MLVSPDDRLTSISSKYYAKRKGYKTASANSLADVLRCVKELSPQVLLMSITITERENIKRLITDIKSIEKDCNIILFAREEESEIIKEAWKSGAFFFLRQGAPLREIGPEVERAFEDYFGRIQIRYLRSFVFVLMPFSDSLDDVYQFGIKQPVEECGLFCQRVDEQHFTESILEQIVLNIKRARFIIADMTGCNPNVFYEVGYAHALEKPIIFLTQDDPRKIPFDLKHKPHIHYHEKEVRNLKKTLLERIKGLLDQGVGMS
ncbi:MAG: hypothetical protein ACLP51_19465 [Syntrophobacteraceae bacterium]